MRHVSSSCVGVILVALAWSTESRPAVGAVVAVVSVKSPITVLTRGQVADIFLGRSTRYPNGDQAVPIDQLESSVARDEFYARFTGKLPAQVKAHWSKVIFTGRGQPPPEAPTETELKRRLASDPHAIGYVEQTAVDASLRVVDAP